MLFSIGHSTRPAEAFVALLKQYGIQYLADVRTRPYSRFNPQYNQKALQDLLESNGITYVYMGDALGGRPEDATLYDERGRPDYALMQNLPKFKEGIARLKTAHEKNIPLAMMCSEGKPTECHRSMLIAHALESENVPVMHIDEKGELKDQQTVMQEIAKGKKGKGLFGKKE